MSGLSPEDYPEYSQFIANKGGNRLGFGTRPALLLVDVNSAYFTSGPLDLRSYEKAGAALETIKTLVTAARAGNCPIIWAQTKYIHPSLRDAGLLATKCPEISALREGSFPEGVAPDENEVIIWKKFPSAFFGTNLLTQLHILGVDTLVIGGACTSGGIRSTALDTMQSGFRAMVRGILLL
jgi:nicotinamidase-related amidase